MLPARQHERAQKALLFDLFRACGGTAAAADPDAARRLLSLDDGAAAVAVVESTAAAIDDVNRGVGGSKTPCIVTAAGVADSATSAALVSLFLERPTIDVNGKDDYGLSALLATAERGHVETARLLCRREETDVNGARVADGYTALHVAASQLSLLMNSYQ